MKWLKEPVVYTYLDRGQVVVRASYEHEGVVYKKQSTCITGDRLRQLLAFPDTEHKQRAIALARAKWLEDRGRAGEPPAPAIQPPEPKSTGQRKRKAPTWLETEEGQHQGMRQWATGSRNKKAAEGKGKGAASAGKQSGAGEMQGRLVVELEKAHGELKEMALELKHKEATAAQVKQEKARLEQELIQVRLGAAVSEPTASRRRVGEAAAARLMQQLRNPGQQRQRST